MIQTKIISSSYNNNGSYTLTVVMVATTHITGTTAITDKIISYLLIISYLIKLGSNFFHMHSQIFSSWDPQFNSGDLCLQLPEPEAWRK